MALNFSDFVLVFYPDKSVPWDDSPLLSDNEQLDRVLEPVHYTENLVRKFNIINSILGFLVNVLHFAVLTRKELRSSAIYILLIGICVFDIIRITASLSLDIKFVLGYGRTEYCHHFDTYQNVLFNIIASLFYSTTNRISSWLIIWMALFRTLSIIFPMSSLTQKLSEPAPALKTLVVTVAATVYYSILNTSFMIIPRNPAQYCLLNANSTWHADEQYRQAEMEPTKSARAWEMILTVSKPITHILLTSFLINAVIEAAKLRKNVRKTEADKSDTTTKLIALMAVLYDFAEITSTLVDFLVDFSRDDDRYMFVLAALKIPIVTLFTINSSSHFFVCFFMSSQYRDTVKNLMGSGKSGTTVWSAEEQTGTLKNSLTG
ncbi:unnamed protein product [Caenorhabditis sp. 36 PRJEB53466]|nr:unnamed protein product [Caenorhabditis sp. 36 PRJEB53466]